MGKNKFTQLGEQCCAVSGELFNNGDGLIWPTHAKHVADMTGRFSSPSGLRYAFLVVGQTKEENTPRQQTQKTGQVIL